MSKTASEKTLEQLSDLGMSLHTALRKCSDSTPTSIIYNLISLESFDEAWHNYLELVLAKGEPVTVDKLKAAASEIKFGNAQRNALICTFRLFDDNDWKGFNCFNENQ